MAHLLIVDDHQDEREALCKYLQSLGHSVAGVPNGKEALASTLEQAPDLIVLDLFMPEMDGTQLLEVLRSYLRLQTLPVVLWTCADDSPALERARAMRVNAIMRKPQSTLEDIGKAVEQELYRAPN